MEALKLQLEREVAHWNMAASRLGDIEALASAEAWEGLEHYVGAALRRHLGGVVRRLQRQAGVLRQKLEAARSPGELEEVRQRLVAFRRGYLRTETTLDFYADAVNTRTNPRISALLRGCDMLARRSMSAVLDQLGKPVPHVLTYLDKGLGASILKAGLRLWDGGALNPAAAIKVVRHNLYRPTSLIHEAGHQVAHITDWNRQLAEAFEEGLSADSVGAAAMWAGWASEIAADAFAFVHTGYASVAALHDVVAGDHAFVFRYIPDDPHPISYLRVLLGTEMCRRSFGPGPWDILERAWKQNHPLEKAPLHVRKSIRRSLPLLPKIARLTLSTPYRSFGGRPLTELADPRRVGPDVLLQLERRVGPALYTSSHWAAAEPLRLLALTGLHVALSPRRAEEFFKQQETWMLNLKIEPRRTIQWQPIQ